ncbi:MAG TPA: CocE/NonD family hydrolase [Gemmatimonadaceae bacterium]|nr:CocE/NonD family hydrolase [Gemmatimonadaceae bacterium]
MRTTLRRLALAALTALVSAPLAGAQTRAPLDSAARAHRFELEQQLESIAVIDRRLMIPMRDGTRLMTDVYRPKNATGPVPIIFVRTPYNFNYWDVRNSAPADMTQVLDAVKRGYAFVEQDERGHFYSEGTYDILGPPRTDGYDMIKWLHDQSWSNGKVGLIGCSSTAEWQMGVAAMSPPGLATIIPESFGAGVGRVKPYYEQGNWYRGGAVQMLFIDWLYGEQNSVRPMFASNTSQADLVRESRLFDLAPQMPTVDWPEAFKHLPEQDILAAVGSPGGIFADSEPVATGGRMIQRAPNDSAWYRGGLYHDDMVIDVPGLYFMTWYDVSTGPNLALFNHVRETASPAIGKQQYAVIAPTLHCQYKRATEHTVVGERDEGDARYDYDSLTFSWFDHFLRGTNNGLLDTLPKVRYYMMGRNKWQTADSWPPAGAQPLTFFLSSAGHANTLTGDGTLAARRPGPDAPDGFTYDPMNPVPSHGGNVCCQPGLLGGAMDQRTMEARPDVLVYTSAPLDHGMEVSGPITLTLYVSSDRKDTDFTVKLEDVYPDGRSYNLEENIQRVRYREGYDKTAFMEAGKVYKVTMQPMQTSNYFEPGHRIRLQISSSNFPRFDRNLNTGGHNYDETTSLVAHNQVHHSKQYPSAVTITVVPHPVS